MVEWTGTSRRHPPRPKRTAKERPHSQMHPAFGSPCKKMHGAVVQVKHRIPVLIGIIVSRQEYVDCSLGIERALSSQRLILVKISCAIATIMNNEIPMASPEIATLDHGLAVL